MKRLFGKALYYVFLSCVFLFWGAAPGFSGLPPSESFSAALFGPAVEQSWEVHGAGLVRPRSLNPVIHWNNLTNDDLREGASRSFVMTSYHPRAFILQEVKVAEQPEGVSVDVFPLGMEGRPDAFRGRILNRTNSICFVAAVRSSEDLLPGNYKIRVNCRFSAVAGTGGALYGGITLFMGVSDPTVRLAMLERGSPEPEASADLDPIPGLIASFDEAAYYDDSRPKSQRLTEQIVHDARESFPKAARKTGLTADGNTRLMLVVTTHNPGRIAFVLKNEDGLAAGFRMEDLEDRSKAVLADGAGDLVLEALPALVDPEKGLHQKTAVLIAPEEFPEPYRGRSDIMVPLELFQYGEDGATVMEASRSVRSILLCEPPTVFLHGLNGEPDKFGSEAREESLFARIWAVSMAEPLSFKYRGYIGPSKEMEPNDKKLYGALKTRFALLNRMGIACTRADLVGHSMGGMMARQFIQNNEHQRSSTLAYQRGLVRRVVTLGSPHLGSPWASYIVGRVSEDLHWQRAPGDELFPTTQYMVDNNWEIIKRIDFLARTLGRLLGRDTPPEAPSLFPLLEPSGKPYSAFEDIACGSDFFRDINTKNLDSDVPMYAISGNVSNLFFNHETIAEAKAKLADLIWNTGALTRSNSLITLAIFMECVPDKSVSGSVIDLGRLLYGGTRDFVNSNDLIVSNASSLWKFEGHHNLHVATTGKEFLQYWHGGLPRAPKIVDEVVDLLRGPASKFIALKDAARRPLPPSARSFLEGAAGGRILPLRGPESRDEGDFLVFPEERREVIVLTANSTDLAPGDPVALRAALPVSGDWGDEPLLVLSSQIQGTGMSYLQAEGNGTWSGTVRMSPEDSGTVTLTALEMDHANKILYVSNTLTLSVRPNLKQVAGIKFQSFPLQIVEGEPEAIALMAVGVQGMFNISDTALGVVFSVEDESVASVSQKGSGEMGTGLILGKKSGKTFLKVSWKGFEAVTPVYVLPRSKETPGSGDVPPDVPVTGLHVEPDSADLKVGERLSLRAVLSPSNATDKRVSWSVSNPSVASADASGNILALAEGTTFVRATAADGVHSADCTVRVARAAVLPTALALTPKSLLLTVGESAALAVSFIPPETTERDVTWSTSNPAVASAEDGQVRAVGVGTAQITAVSAADAGVRAVCSVTVRKKNGGGGTPEELAYYRGRYPDHNVMIASDGDSELLGTDGPDVLVGGTGDNWLEGKGGNDIYVQNLGGGHDTISNRSGGANDVDELHFGPGIIPETLFPYRKGGDLVFSLPDERGEESASTTVEDWYEDAGARLDRIVFMDGTAWTAEDAEKRAGNPPVVLKGGSGADRMKTRSRKKDTVVLYGLEGDDRLKNGKGDDVFVGGPGDDFIRSWSLLGGESHKTFIWNRGDGDDMVDFYFFGQKSGQRRGLLRLGLGIAPGEVSLERRGGSVRVVLPGGSVTFKKARWFTGFHHPDAIVFADGTTWQWGDIPQK